MASNAVDIEAASTPSSSSSTSAKGNSIKNDTATTTTTTTTTTAMTGKEADTGVSTASPKRTFKFYGEMVKNVSPTRPPRTPIDYTTPRLPQDVIRRLFISKIIGLLAVTLTITFAIMSFFLFVEPAKGWMQQNGLLLSMVALIFYPLCFGLLLYRQQAVGNTPPWNYLLLLTFNLSFTFILTPLVVSFHMVSMYLSVGISVLLMLFIAAIGTCTSFDFTRHFCVIALSLLGLFFCSLMVCMVSSFIGAPPLWMTLSKAAMGVTVVMLCLAEEFHMISGPGHFVYHQDDYVLATIYFYVDVATICRLTYMYRDRSS